MSKNSIPSNPEVIKLQNSLQKSISEIRKQSNDDNAYLFLLLALVLHKDGLLGVVRNSTVHTEKLFDIKYIPEAVNAPRRKIYERIFDNLKFEEYQRYLINIPFQYLEPINIKLVSDEEFVKVFEDLLIQLSEINKRNSAFSILPKELIELVYKIDNRTNIHVYNPFSGLGEFSLNNEIGIYHGQEYSSISYIIHLLRILAHNIPQKVFVENENPLYELQNEKNKYDLIVSRPPMGPIQGFAEFSDYGDVRTFQQFFFINAVKKLNLGGKIIAIINNGLLFSGSITTKKIREEWLKNDLVEMVIALPRIKKLFNSEVRSSLIVLNKEKPNSGLVRFIDAGTFFQENEYQKKQLVTNEIESLLYSNQESEFVRYITTEQINDNQSRLDVNEYFLKKYDGKALSEICTVITGGRRGWEGETGRLVKITQLKDDKFDYILNSNTLEFGSIEKCNEISESCLLLALTGGKLKPTYFNYSGESIYIFPNIMALSIDKALVDINYLINELYQEKVIEQVDMYNRGSVIPTVSRQDLLKIVIDIKETPNEQKRLFSKIESSVESEKIALQQSAEYAEKLKKDFKDDLRIKKHNIMQFMNNIISAAEVLKLMMEKNDGTLKAYDLINPKTGNNVKLQFENLIQSAKTAHSYLDHLTDEVAFDKKENLDINELIKDAINQGRKNDDKFEVKYHFHKESFDIMVNDPMKDEPELFSIDPVAFVSKNDFYIVYNNLLENAIKHGFVESGKKYKFKIDLFQKENGIFSDSLTIVFSNNGKPFPKGMADSYCIRGEKAGAEANEGIGSWKVCEIIREHFNGKIEIVDKPHDEFPVQIRIKLPIIGFE